MGWVVFFICALEKVFFINKRQMFALCSEEKHFASRVARCKLKKKQAKTRYVLFFDASWRPQTFSHPLFASW